MGKMQNTTKKIRYHKIFTEDIFMENKILYKC